MVTHAVIAIDPSLRRSGIALWLSDVDGAWRCAYSDARPYRRGVGFGAMVHEVVQAVAANGDGLDGWIGVIERPPPAKRGVRQAPTVADHMWIELLEHLARKRCEAAGEHFRHPMILRPEPSVWRAPLGLATRPPRGMHGLAGRAWLKEQAKRMCALEAKARDSAVLMEACQQDDQAEAALIGLWAIKCVVTPGVYLRRIRHHGKTRIEREEIRWAC